MRQSPVVQDFKPKAMCMLLVHQAVHYAAHQMALKLAGLFNKLLP